MDKYQAVIGIETHVQLKTKSKLFCACNNDARNAEPNTFICPICLGMPGTLPVLNKAAVELALRAGIALNGEIPATTKFDRKNYFYPDLPKGYQITQYDQPIIGSGHVDVPLGEDSFKVRITRAHLEEDAGKNIHPAGADYSLVDLNRAGTPLLEIVSEPDIHTPAEAKAYAQELYNLMRYADVSEVDLYHGNMRFDVNVSVHKPGTPLGTRTETKNLNSFRNIERAVAYEIKRQVEILEKGETITQETRGWDDAKGKTFAQRSKEEAMDYRYFPEPDLPPLVITEAMIKEAQASMPALPAAIRAQLKAAGIPNEAANTLLLNPKLVGLTLEADSKHIKRIANWLIGEVSRSVNVAQFDWAKFKLDTLRLNQLSEMVKTGLLSSTGAKAVLLEMIESTETPEALAKELKVLQSSDTAELEKLVDEVIAENAKAAQDVKNGEAKALGFLVGQVMQKSKGQANPQLVNGLLRQKLQ